MILTSERFGGAAGMIVPIGRFGPAGIQLLGTAFLTHRPGRFVTAAHVVGQDDTNLQVVLPKSKTIFDYQDPSDLAVQSATARLVAHDPFRDLCVLQVQTDASSNLTLGSTDDVGIGSEVAIFGFPHSDAGRMVLTYQQAEVGARVLNAAGGIKSKHIVLNTQARPGQSGSPIFRASDLRMVAILVGSYAPGGGGGISLGGVDPHTLHQTTHAISAEYLLEMLKP